MSITRKQRSKPNISSMEVVDISEFTIQLDLLTGNTIKRAFGENMHFNVCKIVYNAQF